MPVVSVRISDQGIKEICEIAKKEQKHKSTVIQELISEGREFHLLKKYKEGKISLGLLSEELQLSLSESIDLLSQFGIESPITYEDYVMQLKS